MTQDEILQKLTQIFRDIFDAPNLVITLATTAADVEEWDSVNHITLTVETEQKFGIKFQTAELEELKNVGDFARLIDRNCPATSAPHCTQSRSTSASVSHFKAVVERSILIHGRPGFCLRHCIGETTAYPRHSIDGTYRPAAARPVRFSFCFRARISLAHDAIFSAKFQALPNGTA